MTIYRPLFLRVAACLALLVAGCTGADKSARDHEVQPATRLRRLQAGDNWVYDITAVTISDTESINRGGRSSISATSATLNGQSALMLRHQLTYSDDEDRKKGFESATYTYYLQDKTSHDFRVASGPAGQVYREPILYLPGEWKTGLSLSYRGDGERYTLKVTGRERITVPAGTFDTWRVEQTQTKDSETTTSTYWIAPETGAEVRGDSMTKSYRGAGIYRSTFSLRSTNTR